MAYLRELINHTFLRAIYQTSSKQAKLEYKEVQKTHHNNEATALLANANHQTVKFTAQHIIDYIIQHCTCANVRGMIGRASFITSLANVRYANSLINCTLPMH